MTGDFQSKHEEEGAASERKPRLCSQTSRSSPRLIRPTSSFHSACVSRTMFSSSPIETPFWVISTEGHSMQRGHRVTLIDSISRSSLTSTIDTLVSVVGTDARANFEVGFGNRDWRVVTANSMQYRDNPLL